MILTATAGAIILSGPRGFLRANAVMVTCLLLIIGALVWQHGCHLPAEVDTPQVVWGLTPRLWWLAAAVYAAYNVTLALPLLVAVGRSLPSAAVAWLAGATGGTVLAGVIFLITIVLSSYAEPALQAPIPMLLVIKDAGFWAYPAYAAGMLLAMTTTAVSSAYALAHRLALQAPGVERWIGLAVVFLALPVSTVGFIALVRTIYPLFGYGAGLVGIVIAVRRLWRR